MNADRVAWLVDRAEVSDTVTRYFFALDAYDWDAAGDCIADEFTLVTDVAGIQPTPVSRDDFIRDLRARNGGFTATIHLNPSHLVTVEGDTATVTAHMWSAHAVGPLPEDTAWGYGVFHLGLVRTAAGWRLASQRIDIAGTGGAGSLPDLFARAAQRLADGLGHP